MKFGELLALAKRDVTERNKQLGRKTFNVYEINGIQFAVGKEDGDYEDRILVGVKDDLTRIFVCRLNGVDEVIYTVGLDNQGACRFKRGNDLVDPWQVLQSALQRLLFG